VRQLLARAHTPPLRPAAGEAGAALSGITMTRCLGGVVEQADDVAGGLVFDRREPVMVGQASASAAAQGAEDRFDLPLLHGDAITTGTAGI
jgi:hypothetical protein